MEELPIDIQSENVEIRRTDSERPRIDTTADVEGAAFAVSPEFAAGLRARVEDIANKRSRAFNVLNRRQRRIK